MIHIETYAVFNREGKTRNMRTTVKIFGITVWIWDYYGGSAK